MLRQTGCVLIGQTDEIAPADRRLYALRDVTGTVESIPLICASILSKKIAEGIGALVLDVKVGRGAFMKTVEDARQLATWLVGIAERNGVRTEALLTAMDVPLGRAVGNANEVIESIETLKGRGPKDVEDAVGAVRRAHARARRGAATTRTPRSGRCATALTQRAGLETFRAIIEAQGGDPRVIDDYARLPQPAAREHWVAPRDGVVTDLDAELVGRAAVALGAGRDRVDAAVDPAAGIDILAPIGSGRAAGDPVLTMACGDAAQVAGGASAARSAVTIGDERASAAAPRGARRQSTGSQV